MCSAEGDYIDAVKTDGSKIKFFWWDLGDSVPWRDEARYNEPFPWTTVFLVEGKEIWSQCDKAVANGAEMVRLRMAEDNVYLEDEGIFLESMDIISRGVPIPFEDRHTHART